MTYVLILMVAANSLVVETQEFSSETACRVAKTAFTMDVREAYGEMAPLVMVVATCAPK